MRLSLLTPLALVTLTLLAWPTLGQEQAEPFCLKWNFPSVCFFETVYPLYTDEDHTTFYQYGKPFGASANAGLEVSDITQVFLLRDKFGQPGSVLGLTTIHDKPVDGTGGRVTLAYTAEGTGFPADPYIVKDDPNEGGGTAFQYNTVTESGTSTWAWIDCCTDGFTIGPLTSPINASADDYSLKFKYSQLLSSTTTASNSGPDWTLPLFFRTAPPLQPTKLLPLPMRNGSPYDEFQLYPGECTPRPKCDLPCFECQADPECGWCGTTQTCHDRTCDAGFTNCTASAQDETCPTSTYCGTRDGCKECNVESVCGLCSSFVNTTMGNSTMVGINSTCIAIDEITFNFTSCDAGFNSSFAFCPAPPPVEGNRTQTNITEGELDLNELLPPPTPGEGIPVWIWIAVGVAVLLLILVVAFVVFKLMRVKQEVAEILAFENADGVKENPLFEAQATEGLNPLYEG